TERPSSDTPLSLELRTLRQVAGRLQAVVRQRTRLVNQFHHLLALTFPELALRTKDLAAGCVLELVQRYPTAQRLAPAPPPVLACGASETARVCRRTACAGWQRCRPRRPGARAAPLRHAPAR